MTKPTIDLIVPRKALYAAVVSGLVVFSYSSGIRADVTANPQAASRPLMLAATCNPCAAKKAACNPCALKKKSACGACNPCALKKKAACGACNPCALKKKAACGACNPCAIKKKAACGACNPCAAKKTSSANPCNPCAVKKVAGACNPCNPCALVPPGPQMLVTGVLVDTRCYGFDQQANVGNTHKMGGATIPGCATACAKLGIPVAILDGGQSGGQLYALAAPAPAFADYMGMEARMTGTEIVGGVMLPVSLEVKTDKGWKKVSVTGMM